jgi:four helix bundle protein
MTHDNVLYDLSKKFALRIIKLYSHLTKNSQEFIMSKQIYRCGTSIGANIAESMNAQSKADFVSKLSISLKEATETKYWLELLYESAVINELQFESLVNDLNIIIGTLINTIKKTKINGGLE